MKTLIIEDDIAKLRALLACLSEVEGFDVDAVAHVVDTHSAKRHIRETHYDLLILDIALPPRSHEDVQRDAGVVFVDEILGDHRYKAPTHIIGITAHDDVYTLVEARFSQRLLTLLRYDSATNDWKRGLQARVRHIITAIADKLVEQPEYQSHLAVVCALESPELESVLRLDWSWKQIRVPGDDTIYYRGEFEVAGIRRIVHAAAAARMGMPATTILTMKMIVAFRPNYIVMTGIAAGVRARVKFGDILVADPSWDYGNGKRIEKKSGNSFLSAPHQLPLDTGLRYKFRSFAADTALWSKIRQDWPGDKPDHILTLRLGPFASGASVLADQTTLTQVLVQHRELLGIDMETYGVFAASAEISHPRPLAFSLKSVVDFADGEKDDRYQRYSAFTSAQALKYFVEHYL